MLFLKDLVSIKPILRQRKLLQIAQSPHPLQLPRLKAINPRGVAVYLTSSLLHGAVVLQQLQGRSHLKLRLERDHSWD